jgi:hypothetical protein
VPDSPGSFELLIQIIVVESHTSPIDLVEHEISLRRPTIGFIARSAPPFVV